MCALELAFMDCWVSSESLGEIPCPVCHMMDGGRWGISEDISFEQEMDTLYGCFVLFIYRKICIIKQ